MAIKWERAGGGKPHPNMKAPVKAQERVGARMNVTRNLVIYMIRRYSLLCLHQLHQLHQLLLLSDFQDCILAQNEFTSRIL